MPPKLSRRTSTLFGSPEIAVCSTLLVLSSLVLASTNDLPFSSNDIDRFPNHDASKRIQESEEHREDLDLLKSNDADYHHGFQAGVLAAARMFKEHSDILHINNEGVSELTEP